MVEPNASEASSRLQKLRREWTEQDRADSPLRRLLQWKVEHPKAGDRDLRRKRNRRYYLKNRAELALRAQRKRDRQKLLRSERLASVEAETLSPHEGYMYYLGKGGYIVRSPWPAWLRRGRRLASKRKRS